MIAKNELTTEQPALSGFFYDQSPRAQAIALEQAIRDELTPIEFDVRHHHSYGVYGRELIVPAGSVIVGHIHKHTNMNVLLEGEMSVMTDDGMKRVGAGFLVVS